MVLVRRGDVTSVDLSGLANLSRPGSAFSVQAGYGIKDSLRARMSTQIRNREGSAMSHEESLSMSGELQEESMSMGQPEEESMSMRQPEEESMGQPEEESMSMGQPGREPMPMGEPPEEST
jgi:hypothetical protein